MFIRFCKKKKNVEGKEAYKYNFHSDFTKVNLSKDRKCIINISVL